MAEEKRDSLVIYRSFYEAIKTLPKEDQADAWNAIFEFGLNFEEIEVSGLAKTIFTLVKPQIESNIKKYFNGKAEKTKQTESKPEAPKKQTRSKTGSNVSVSVSVSDNGNENVNEIHTLQVWIKEKCVRVSKLQQQLTFEECTKLVSEFGEDPVKKILEAMENRKELNYVSVNRTIRNWISRDNKPHQNGFHQPVPPQQLKQVIRVKYCLTGHPTNTHTATLQEWEEMKSLEYPKGKWTELSRTGNGAGN